MSLDGFELVETNCGSNMRGSKQIETSQVKYESSHIQTQPVSFFFFPFPI